jgi:hypothetical protein
VKRVSKKHKRPPRPSTLATQKYFTESSPHKSKTKCATNTSADTHLVKLHPITGTGITIDASSHSVTAEQSAVIRCRFANLCPHLWVPTGARLPGALKIRTTRYQIIFQSHRREGRLGVLVPGNRGYFSTLPFDER